MKISKSEINYIEFTCMQLIKSLNDFNEEIKDNSYIYASPNRAKFDRLRIELNKELMKIRKVIYNENN